MKQFLALVAAAALTACSTAPGESVTNAIPSDAPSNRSPVSQITEIKDLNQVKRIAEEIASPETLLVVDVDDTMLTANEFFGSDKWYEWQRGRAKDPTGKDITIEGVQQVNCLFDFLSVAFEIGTNKLTQPDAAEIIDSIDLDQLVLTARGEDYRSATMRELLRNSLSFSDEHLVPDNEAIRFVGADESRQAPVSYIDGVYMVSGLNKGTLLLDLLAEIDKSYSSVILVDDKENNIVNMQNALQEAGIDFYGFQYTRVDKSVSEAEVAQAVDAASDLNAFLKEHFPERVEVLTSQSCALRQDLVR
ncbi:MAG: DUF2608 domain-containing protein [Elainellaceae cyanobacterium]